MEIGNSKTQDNHQSRPPSLDEYGRTSKIQLCSFSQPFARSFHMAWLGFFVAFTGWFAFAPLMNYVKEDLQLSKSEIDISNMASISITILFRFLLGPLCEKYGPRKTMSTLLLIGSIPVFCSKYVSNFQTLIVVRSFTGILGACFIPCQFFTSINFSSKIVGTANALAGGWGNLGGGMTMLLMIAFVELLERCGLDTSSAWRNAFIFPSTILIFVSAAVWFGTKDCPQGNWSERLYNKPYIDQSIHGQTVFSSETFTMPTHVNEKSKNKILDSRVWILGIQYGASFGVELAVNNIISIFFYESFVDDSGVPILSMKTASLVASLFGLTNIFARAAGGIISDTVEEKLKKKFKPKWGRMLVQCVLLFFEGISLIVFSKINNIFGSISMLIVFSILVQASEGSTFSLVPFLHKNSIGVTAGIVGAFGNIGGVLLGLLFNLTGDYRTGIFYIGNIVILCALLSFFNSIEGTYLLSPKKEKRERTRSTSSDENMMIG